MILRRTLCTQTKTVKQASDSFMKTLGKAPIAGLLMLLCMFAHASDQQRTHLLAMRDTVVQRLYQQDPYLRLEIARAAGYAVFSATGVNALFFAAGKGHGVAHHNRRRADTYMKMASAGVGLGVGLKNYHSLFVFHTEKAYRRFVEKGWEFSGQADAVAQSDLRGRSSSTAVSGSNGVSVYQLTERGLSLQATLQGSRYWPDPQLN